MANSRFQQFFFSKTPMLTGIHGAISIVQEVKATRVTQGLTLTATNFGSASNAISIAFTPGATAGAEVVTVTGNAISVQIETGVSSVTQVRTAMQLVAACTALVVTTGTSASAVATASALLLTGGIDGVASESIVGASVVQSGVGEYTVTLAESYNAVMSVQLQVLAATAVDLVPQIKSVDVVSAKTIVFRLLAGATATDPSAALTVYIAVLLRNSSVSQ